MGGGGRVVRIPVMIRPQPPRAQCLYIASIRSSGSWLAPASCSAMAALTSRLGSVRPHLSVRGWAIWRSDGPPIVAVVWALVGREFQYNRRLQKKGAVAAFVATKCLGKPQLHIASHHSHATAINIL